eukprot:7729332-Pyramimonas_sp.AAC.1
MKAESASFSECSSACAPPQANDALHQHGLNCARWNPFLAQAVPSCRCDVVHQGREVLAFRALPRGAHRP